jgi:hypothetical protein
MGCGSSERDNSDAIRRLCVNDRNGRTLKETEGYEALFAVSKPVVFVGDRRSGKDARRVSEI